MLQVMDHNEPLPDKPAFSNLYGKVRGIFSMYRKWNTPRTYRALFTFNRTKIQFVSTAIFMPDK